MSNYSDYTLHMTYRRMLHLFDKKNLRYDFDGLIHFSESENYLGFIIESQDSYDGKYHINIGGCRSKFFKISDYQFIQTGVTLFHELRHYHQYIDKNVNLEILISRVSVYNNPEYYHDFWSELPHEVDAEYFGVMNMWDFMSEHFPDKADSYMLQYLNKRIYNTTYMIKPVLGHIDSREGAEQAFEQAYADSLQSARTPHGGFARYDDEVSRLLTERGRVKPEYAYHFGMLMDSMPGRQKDRMMASLVLSLHPDLADRYHLDTSDVPDVLSEFGRKLPDFDRDAVIIQKSGVLWCVLSDADSLERAGPLDEGLDFLSG